MSLSVKAYLQLQSGEEIRRFSIPQEASTSFAYFVEKVQRVFPQLLRQEFNLSWKDLDGEKVTFSSDEELTEALGCLVGDFFRVYIDAPTVTAKKADSTPDAEHPGVVCDACDGGIRGTRFKCVSCPDFDLCSACENQGFHPEHEMIRIRTPRKRPSHGHPGGPGHCRGGRGPSSCGGGPRGKGPWRQFRPPFHPHSFAHSFAFCPPPFTANDGSTSGPSANQQGFPWAWPTSSNWNEATDEAFKDGASGTSKHEGDSPKDQQQQPPPDMNTIFKAVGDMMNSLFTNPQQFQANGPASNASTEPSKSDSDSTPASAPPSGDATNVEEKVQDGQESVAAAASSPDFVMVDNGRAEYVPPRALTSDEIFQMRLSEATMQLEQMGFKNEGGWLTTLLIEKQCDVGKVLDTLQPGKQ